MSSNPDQVPQMVGVYKKLFVFLVTITALGIAVTFLHFPIWAAILIALTIIVVKGKVVLDSFKPLLKGRTGLIVLFGLTLVLFMAVLILPLLFHHDKLEGTEDLSKQLQLQEHSGGGYHHGD